MITFIYPYRGREDVRVKKSLESLQQQTKQEFKAVFVDYGTEKILANQIKETVSKYDFIKYIYTYERDKPWNKSRAINIALNEITSPFVFVADIDVIFAPQFVETLLDIKEANKALYFKVGFLSETETKIQKPFNAYDIKFASTFGATGLTLFPTEKLKAIGGFDEFYHYWGAEDTDAHVRIQNVNVPIAFYDKEILLLHQWHPIYRSGSEKELTQHLRIADVVRLNHQHLKFNQTNGVTKVNSNPGKLISKDEYLQLQQPTREFKRESLKSQVDHILMELQYFSDEVISYQITAHQPTFKDQLKVLLKKQEQIAFYTLKDVNDILLKEILIHYSRHNYKFVVAQDLSSITFTIAL